VRARSQATVARLARALAGLQRRRPAVAVLFGTYKKFSDDQAGYLAALIAYYGFAALLPLLLALISFLQLIASEDPGFRHQLLHSALSQYPGVASELKNTGPGLATTGFALASALIFTAYAAHRFASAVQNALNTVWGVPRYRRPKLPLSLLRSFGLIAVMGPGLITTVTLAGAANGVGELGGAGSRVLAVCVSLLLNVGLFWLGFRIATSREVSTGDLRLSAIMSAVSWEILQLTGSYFISHQLRSNSAYGAFGIVLGLLAWLYLQAQLSLYLVEFNVVRVKQLWPRMVVPPPVGYADIRAYDLGAQASLRRPELVIEVRRRDRTCWAIDHNAHAPARLAPVPSRSSPDGGRDGGAAARAGPRTRD
jgi:membrane protein